MPKAATTHLRKEHKKKAGISSNSRKTKSWPRPRPGEEEGVFMRLCHARPPFRRKRRPAQRIDTVDGPQLDDGWSKYACPRFRKRKEKKKKSTPIMQTSIYIDIWRGATNNHSRPLDILHEISVVPDSGDFKETKMSQKSLYAYHHVDKFPIWYSWGLKYDGLGKRLATKRSRATSWEMRQK